METEFDTYQRPTNIHDPNLGLRQYRYTPFGNVASITDANGDDVAFDYDQIGRVIQRSTPSGTDFFEYDTGVIGRLTSATTESGDSVLFSYDALGRPVQRSHTIQNERFDFDLAYDAHGRLESTTYPESQIVGGRITISSLYDEYGNEREVRDDQGTTHWRLAFSDAAGRPGRVELGNNTTAQFAYQHDSGNLAWITSSGPTGVLQDLRYEHDLHGNVTKRADFVTSQQEEYRYDALDRLVDLGTCSIDYPGCQTQNAISYQASGNIAWKWDVGSYQYDGNQPHAVRAAGQSSYSYDANGNMVQRDDWAIAYNAINKPIRFEKGSGERIEVTYDAFDNRSYKRAEGNTNTEVYSPTTDFRVDIEDGQRLKETLSIRSPDGGVIAELVADATGMNAVYHHNDHLGSAEVLTNASGQQIERRSFDPFGAPRDPDRWDVPVPASQIDGGSGYTGHLEDREFDLNLTHMKGRSYDAKLGRFLTPDPYVQSPYFSQSLNRFSYVWNNPVNNVDPSGFQTEDAAIKRSYSSGRWTTEIGYGVSGYERDRADRGTSGSGGSDSWIPGLLAEIDAGLQNAIAPLAGNIVFPDISPGAFTNTFDRQSVVNFIPVSNPNALIDHLDAVGHSTNGFIAGVVDGANPFYQIGVYEPASLAYHTGMFFSAIGGLALDLKAVYTGANGLINGSTITLSGGGAVVGVPAVAASSALIVGGAAMAPGHLKNASNAWDGINGTLLARSDFRKRGPKAGGARASASKQLRDLGLEGVKLHNKSYNSGRKALTKAGFLQRGKTKTGRQVFEHPTKKTRVYYDSGRALTNSQKPHWHIFDVHGFAYNRGGRKVAKSTNAAHIPAK